MANKKPKLWKMPEWMRDFEKHFANTGGNSVEELVNGNDDPRVNLPLSTLQFGAKCQVSMLLKLHSIGLIRGWQND